MTQPFTDYQIEKNNMKKLILITSSLLLLFLSSLTWGGAETGLYLGGSLGSSDLDGSLRDGETDININGDDSGYKIFAGYNFGIAPIIDLAIEGSYVDFGEGASEIQGRNAAVGVKGWDAFGLAGIKLGPIGVFAKAGAIAWDSESKIPTHKRDDSGRAPAYGAGIRFQLGSLALRAEYEVFDIEVAEVEYVSVGAAWTF
jgi:hypothetical protein